MQKIVKISNFKLIKNIFNNSRYLGVSFNYNQFLLYPINKNFAAKQKEPKITSQSYETGSNSGNPQIKDPFNEEESKRIAEEREGFKKLTDFLLKREVKP